MGCIVTHSRHVVLETEIRQLERERDPESLVVTEIPIKIEDGLNIIKSPWRLANAVLASTLGNESPITRADSSEMDDNDDRQQDESPVKEKPKIVV